MHAIQEWINNHLIEWGIISSSANELDNTIVLLLIIAVTVGIDYACRYIFLNMFKRLAKRTRNQWDDLIVERKIINKLMHMIPAILVYVLLPLAFPVDETPKILGILQMICKIYIIAVSLRFISASLNVVHEIYNRKESLKNKPLKGFIQLLQVAVFFIGFILIISILIGKSPTTLFAGLGASAAILMLVFKDTLLGFVAGIQLSANDMLRPGDWITMEKYGAATYTHLRAHETVLELVCRLLLEKKTNIRAHETGRNIVCRHLPEKKNRIQQQMRSSARKR